ncbi:uncharacterized protein LOC144197751 [Stigmatopora nigra]
MVVKIDGEFDGEEVADNIEETTIGVDNIGTEAVINASLDSKVSQEVVEEIVSQLDQSAEDNNTQVLISDVGIETEAAPTVEETDYGGMQVQETDEDTDLSQVEEHLEAVRWMEESLKESEVTVLPFENFEIKATQPVVEEPQVREETYIGKEMQNNNSEQSQVEEEVQHIGIVVGEKESVGGDSQENTAMKRGYEVLVNGGDEQHAGVEVTSQTTNEEDLETTVISALEREDEVSLEHRPKNQGAVATSTALNEHSENVFTDHGNEILTPTEDFLSPDSNVAQPTLDYFVKNTLVIPPKAREEQNEYTAKDPETKEINLESWKIGVAVVIALLVLETVLIIIYILKHRNKNSSQATQHSSEKGCDEPELTTGGNSNENTLHAGNGDPQQYPRVSGLILASLPTVLGQGINQYYSVGQSYMAAALPGLNG